MAKSLKKLVVLLEEMKNRSQDQKEKLKHLSKVLDYQAKGCNVYAIPLIGENINIQDYSLEKALQLFGIENLSKEEVLREIEINEVIEMMSKHLYEFFTSSNQELENGCRHIDSFSFLSDIFEQAKFSDFDIFEIIKESISRNEKTGFINVEAVTLDGYKLHSFPFKSVTEKERDFYLETDTRLLFSKRDELDKKGQAFVDEIIESLDELVVTKHDELNDALKNAIEILLHKENTYTEEDIDELISALKEMELAEKYAAVVRNVLEIKLEKRRKKEQEREKISKISSNAYQKELKHYMTDKEYKELRKKLKEYYDPDHGKLKQQLSYEKMIEVASIMIHLNYDKKAVYTFLKCVFEGIEEQHTIASFIRDYNKYIYYFGEESVLEIIEYLNEMMIVSDLDYAFWKNEVEYKIEVLNGMITKVDYEYQLAKKM